MQECFSEDSLLFKGEKGWWAGRIRAGKRG